MKFWERDHSQLVPKTKFLKMGPTLFLEQDQLVLFSLTRKMDSFSSFFPKNKFFGTKTGPRFEKVAKTCFSFQTYYIIYLKKVKKLLFV